MKLRLVLGFVSSLWLGCGDPVCGNQKTEDGEQCDDGNQTNGDGCEVTCQNTPLTCGNGIIDVGELCLVAPVVVPVGAFPNAVVVGNFDDDPKPDLAVSNGGDETIGILINDREGNNPFIDQQILPLQPGESTASLAVGDFDGDGRDELAAVEFNNQQLLVFEVFFNGTLQVNLQQTIPSIEALFSVDVADLDEDSFLDLFTPDIQGGSAFFGQVGGTFETTPVSFNTGIFPNEMISVELNGDNLLDLVTTDSTDNVSVFLNQGNRAFQKLGSFAVVDNPGDIASGDFNEDSGLDFVTANVGSDDAGILLGSGGGTLDVATNLGVGDFPLSVAVGDLNADGFDDFVVANSDSNNVSLFLGKGDGTFETPQALEVGTQPVDLLLADFTEDGVLDLVVVNRGSAQLSFFAQKP